MKTRFLIAATLAATASIAPAAVGERQPSGIVRYSDLDLTSRAGAALFRHRVDEAVVSLSGGGEARSRPDVVAARHRARMQADAVIRAAA